MNSQEGYGSSSCCALAVAFRTDSYESGAHFIPLHNGFIVQGHAMTKNEAVKLFITAFFRRSSVILRQFIGVGSLIGNHSFIPNWSNILGNSCSQSFLPAKYRGTQIILVIMFLGTLHYVLVIMFLGTLLPFL